MTDAVFENIPGRRSAAIRFRAAAEPVAALVGIIAACALSTIASAAFICAPAWAADGATICDVYGTSRSELVGWLESHEDDGYYLATPYRPYDWRSPAGDVNGWGADSDGTSAGMNCTGFVWHALCCAHGWQDSIAERLPALTGWASAIRDEGLQSYTFPDKGSMLASGVLEKGDLIWMWADGNPRKKSVYHHLAVFWGDTPGQDLAWASTGTFSAGSWSGANEIGPIEAKSARASFEVVKLGGAPGGGIVLDKASTRPELTDGNGAYCLDGAVYGVFASEELAATHDAARALRTYRTDASGHLESPRELRAATYYVAETDAPLGYGVDPAVYETRVVAGQTSRVQAGETSVPEQPGYRVAGRLALKADPESPDGKALGAAVLEGALLQVSYYDGYYDAPEDLPESPTRSWVIATDEEGWAYAREEAKVSGDEFYRLDDGQVVLPLGTLAVREASAPRGYGENAEALSLTRIGQDDAFGGQMGGGAVIFDWVIRSDIAFTKVDALTGRPMGNVAFAITSATSGERHLVASDEQGVVSTQSSHAAHTAETNGNDVALVERDGTWHAAGELLDADRGVWFSGRADAPGVADDGRAALPFDTYLIEELPCEANEGYELVAFSVTVDGQSELVSAGVVQDMPLAGEAGRIYEPLAETGDARLALAIGALVVLAAFALASAAFASIRRKG